MASEQPNQAPLTPAGVPTSPVNAGRGIPNKNAIQEALLDTASAGYKPSLPIRGFTYDYWPVYQFWFDVDDMLEHSSIFTPLMFTQAPIMVCEHEITASDKTVQAFCQATRDRFWTNCVRPIIDASDAYGWMGGEVVYHHVGEYLALDKIKAFAPRDVAPLLLEGEMVGVQVRNGMAGEVKLWTGADKVPSKGFWHAHRPRFGYVYGQSILKPAWRDWKRLAGRDGIEETADVGAYRYSLGLTIIRYPNEGVRDEHGREIASRDVAREMGESLKAGASIELPSTRQATKGNDGDYKWDLDFKTPEIQLSELSERENQLRKRIAGSIGCPPELLEAADTGSGFSGRMIPMMGFLLSRQAHANELTENFVERILKPLVFWNFGPKAWVQVKVKPLLETFHKLFAPQPGGGAIGAAGTSGTGAAGSLSPASAAVPKGPNSPEKILAAIVNAKREARLSGDPHANDREIEVLKNMMGAGGAAPEGEQHITAALGWQGEATRRGGIKAVGTAEHAGRVLYGQDAQRALQGGNNPAGQADPTGTGSTAATPASAPAKPPRKKTPANAYGVLDKLHRNRAITLDDVHGFVKHIKTMSDEDLNSVHSLLVNRLGGTESHDRAVKHLRGLAKQHMAHRGLGGSPAATPPPEVEAGSDGVVPDEMYRSKTPAKLHMDEEPATPQRSRTPARLHLDDEATIPQEPAQPQRSKTPAKVHTDAPTPAQPATSPQATPVKPATKKPSGDPFAEYEPTGQKIDHPPEVPTLEPVTPDAKPNNNLRPNDALDDFMAEPTNGPIKPVDYQIPKPPPATTPVKQTAPAKQATAPTAAASPSTPKPVSVHPDLAKHDAYNDAAPRFRSDLRDVHAEHVGKTAKQLHRLATKQDLDVENAKGDPTEHAYQQHKANLLWEMHGKARRDELKAKLKPVAPATKPQATADKPIAQPEPTPVPQPKGERRVHPHLAKMDAFNSAHPDHQDHLRDIHANNLGRTSGALLRSAHRHDRAVQEAHESNPAEAPRHQAVANLLWEMHGKARRDEQQKRLGQQQAKAKSATAPNETTPSVDPDAERRRKAADARLEKFRTQEPKRIPQNKLRYIVRQNGGLNPASIGKDFNLQEDVKEGGFQHLMRHDGKNLDEAADELVSSGHLRVPAGREADEYLLERLQQDADHDQGVSDEHRMEHAFHQHLAQQYEQHKADFEAAMEEARGTGEHESSIAEAIRQAEIDGKTEAHAALPPDAQEGDGPDDDFPFGANGGDGESDAGGTGTDGTGVDDFDFGANAADDTSEDDGDNPFTPDVPGQRSYESEPREEQEQQAETPETEVTPATEARQEDPQEVTKPTPPTDADRDEALAQAGPAKQPSRDDEAYALDQQRREQVADSNAKEADAQVRPDDPRGRFWKDARPDDIYEGASQSVTGDRKNDEATPDAQRANAAYAEQRRANLKATPPKGMEMTPEEAEAEYEAYQAKKKGQANANPNPQSPDTPDQPQAQTSETNPTATGATTEEGKEGEVEKPKTTNGPKEAWQSAADMAASGDVDGAMSHFAKLSKEQLEKQAKELGVFGKTKTDVLQKLRYSLQHMTPDSRNKKAKEDANRKNLLDARHALQTVEDGSYPVDAVGDAMKRFGLTYQQYREEFNGESQRLKDYHAEFGKKELAEKVSQLDASDPEHAKIIERAKAYVSPILNEASTKTTEPKPKAPRPQATPTTRGEHDAAHWQQAAERLREQGKHPSGKDLAAEFKKVQAEAKAKLAPHELRQADYLDQHKPDWSQRTVGEMRDDHKKMRNPANKAQAAANLAKAIEHGQAAHQEQVKRALAEGKTVPPHVLADYPQLGKTKEDGPAPPRAVTSDHKELANSIKQRIAAIREEEERLPTSREDEVQRTLQEKRARQQRMEKMKQKGPLDWSHFATHEEFTDMNDMNHPGWEAVDNHNAELIEANSKESDVEPRHGMTHKEPMRSIQVGHLHIHYAHDGYGVHHAAYVASLLAASPIHEGIAKHTHEIVLTGQSNKDDPYWQKEFKNPNFKAAATGQGGTVVVYNHATLGGIRGIAHEMGHNMAHKLFGSVTPHADSEFAKASKAEGPTSDYGGHNLAEDFAESVAHYHDNPTQFKRDFPKKCRILMDMLKDKEANRG